MAFPTIPTSGAGRIVSSTNLSPAGTHTFPDLNTLTKNAGDLIIAIVVMYDGNTTNAEFSGWGAGFTEFVDQATATTMGIGCAYLFSDGTETGTFTVTSSDTSTNDSVCILMSIAGAHPSTPPEGGTITNGTAAAADIAALNPTGWGAEDTLWIAVAGSGETATTGSYTGVASAPTNYTNYFDTGITADVVGGVEGAVAFRQLNAASEDPGTFSVDTSNARNSSLLLAVRPAATTDAPAENVAPTVTSNDPDNTISLGSEHSSLTVTSNDPDPGISPTAGEVTCTVTANDATITTEAGGNAAAGVAEVTVTANNISNNIIANAEFVLVKLHSRPDAPETNADAGLAVVTVTAENLTSSGTTTAATAALSAIANQPAINIQPNAGNAPVNAVAFDATISGDANAIAGNAAVAVVANQPSISIQLNSGNAALTALANDITGKSSPVTTTAPVTVSANPPAKGVAVNAGNAAVAVVANGSTGRVSMTPTTAPVNAVAFDATISTANMTNANAGFAAVSAIANQPKVNVNLGAGNSAVAIASNQPGLSVKPNSGLAAISAVSNNATVTKAVAGNAGNAAVVATANGLVAFINTGAGLAIVGVTAEDGSTFVPEPLENPPFIIRDGVGMIIQDGQPGVVIIRDPEGLTVQNSDGGFIIRDP